MNKIKKIIAKILSPSINKNINFSGNMAFFVLLIKNLLKPKIIYKKVKYNQLPRNSINKNKKTNDLIANGICKIEGKFVTEIEELQKYYNSDSNHSSSAYKRFKSADVKPLSVSIDDKIIDIIYSYMGCQPYLRHPPGFNHTQPDQNYTSQHSSKFNVKWHYDTVNQVTMHVLLTDVTNKQTRMLYAKNTHKKHHISLTPYDYYYDDDYIKSTCNNIIDLTGKAGDVYIFDSNGVHKMYAVKNSLRRHLHVNYTPGNDIKSFGLKDEMILNVSKIPSLTNIQKKSLSLILS